MLTLANPPVNALGAALRAALDEALTQVIADVSVRAVVLAAEGKVFVGGADIGEFGKPQRPPSLPDILDRLDASPKPVVAAGQGGRRNGVGNATGEACGRVLPGERVSRSDASRRSAARPTVGDSLRESRHSRSE